MQSANNNTHKLDPRDNYNASVFQTRKPGLVWTFGGEEEGASCYPELTMEKPEKREGGGAKRIFVNQNSFLADGYELLVTRLASSG